MQPETEFDGNGKWLIFSFKVCVYSQVLCGILNCSTGSSDTYIFP